MCGTRRWTRRSRGGGWDGVWTWAQIWTWTGFGDWKFVELLVFVFIPVKFFQLVFVLFSILFNFIRLHLLLSILILILLYIHSRNTHLLTHSHHTFLPTLKIQTNSEISTTTIIAHTPIYTNRTRRMSTEDLNRGSSSGDACD